MISTVNMVCEGTLFDGVQRLYRFVNGYGASVVRHFGSYGVRVKLDKKGEKI